MIQDVLVADSYEAILEDPSFHLVATSIIPAERYQLGLETMDHQKDFFTAKTPFTTLEQLELVREKIKETKKMYAVYYSERLKEDSHIFAGRAIDDGRIGRVVQVLGMGPHRLAPETRPDWFFDTRSEEHTSELQSRGHLVCRLLLEKKKKTEEFQIYPIHKTIRCGLWITVQPEHQS